MSLNPETIASLSPAGLFEHIMSMSDADIRADLGGEYRREILEAVFAHFPAQFRADKAGDRSARIDFRITGGPGDSSDTYAVVVEDGTCRIEPGASESPDLSLMLGPVGFLKLITGSGHDVHDGQDQGPRRHRPGRRPLELVRDPEGLTLQRLRATWARFRAPLPAQTADKSHEVERCGGVSLEPGGA